MTTSHVHDLLALHAGGDLDPADSARVEAHLATCADCRTLAEGYAESRAWLAAAPDAPFSAADRTAIRQAVMDQVRREARPRIQAWKPLLGAAAALMLLLAGLRAWHPATVQAPASAPSQAQGTGAQATPQETPASEGSRDLQASAGAPTPAPSRPGPTTALDRPARTVQVARFQAPADPASDGPQPLAAPTRIEIQTDNPNIRIIWLAQATPEQPGTPSLQE